MVNNWLKEVLKDSNYYLTLFDEKEIKAVDVFGFESAVIEEMR
jgi:hypothetical protein